jgi:hypothetical protein
MRERKVVFSVEAEAELLEIYDWACDADRSLLSAA